MLKARTSPSRVQASSLRRTMVASRMRHSRVYHSSPSRRVMDSRADTMCRSRVCRNSPSHRVMDSRADTMCHSRVYRSSPSRRVMDSRADTMCHSRVHQSPSHRATDSRVYHSRMPRSRTMAEDHSEWETMVS